MTRTIPPRAVATAALVALVLAVYGIVAGIWFTVGGLFVGLHIIVGGLIHVLLGCAFLILRAKLLNHHTWARLLLAGVAGLGLLVMAAASVQYWLNREEVGAYVFPVICSILFAVLLRNSLNVQTQEWCQ